MSDDAKGALTTFVSSLPPIPSLLLILGVAVFAVGLAGGITYHGWFVLSRGADSVLAGAGALIALSGLVLLFKEFTGKQPKAKEYDIKFTYPSNNDIITKTDAKGTIKRELPDGYSLYIFRVYPDNSFYPMRLARVDTTSNTWVAHDCDLGEGDRRDFVAYLVGPGGTALIDYSREAARVHEDARKKIIEAGGKADFLPLCKQRTPDMIECARVTVRRA